MQRGQLTLNWGEKAPYSGWVTCVHFLGIMSPMNFGMPCKKCNRHIAPAHTEMAASANATHGLPSLCKDHGAGSVCAGGKMHAHTQLKCTINLVAAHRGGHWRACHKPLTAATNVHTTSHRQSTQMCMPQALESVDLDHGDHGKLSVCLGQGA